MNAGPPGFRGAPITKALILTIIGSSIVVQTLVKNARRPNIRGLGRITHALVFLHPGELFFGALLTYYFRLFERHMGTPKYGAYIVVVSATGFALETVLSWAFHRPSASGPYPLLFANMVAFFLEVPYLQRFYLFGFPLTDKIFVYLVALQLSVSSMQRSAVAAVCGVLVGLVYHLGLFGLWKIRLPKSIENFLANSMRRSLSVPGVQPQPAVGPATEREPPPVPMQPSPEALRQLVDMGFEPAQAGRALVQTGNNFERALQLLL